MIELLKTVDPIKYQISQVVVWGGRATLDQIEERPWLVKVYHPILDKNLLYRAFWQRFRLAVQAKKAKCNVLFVPGGSYAGTFSPIVTMSQNLLPFEWNELRRFGWSWMTCKLILLRIVQSRSFRRADGLIFLTHYAHDIVMKMIKTITGKAAIIPHGVGKRFSCSPRKQLAISSYSVNRPFRILYVSIIDEYKHQWRAAEAVAKLRACGLRVTLELIGPAYPPALKRLRKTLARIDPTGEIIKYHGTVPYSELHEQYAKADLCLFASSCENMPNILLEGMASGLPIACSKRGPMPEVLGDAGVYFDPEDVQDIAESLQRLIVSPELRSKMAEASFVRSQLYSWTRCAEETFEFLAKVATQI